MNKKQANSGIFKKLNSREFFGIRPTVVSTVVSTKNDNPDLSR